MTATSSPHDIVITGLGILTAHGLGMGANLDVFEHPSDKSTQEDLKVKGFNPVPHLTDRKVVKVVSHRDALGLVAFEECLRNSGISSKTINPDRTGLYVGAPPSSCIDHHNYNEGILASVDPYGQLQEKNFGENFRSASPTTLLTGLPNNVLCYGAKTLDARGPNSNYTTMETSAHMAIIGACRSIKLGRLDCAVAGGYSAHSDKVFAASARQRGLSSGTPISEGAAFATIETRENATKRGAKPICSISSITSGSDAIGPYEIDPSAGTLTNLIRNALAIAGVTTGDIAVIMMTGSGINSVDQAEQTAVNALWSQDEKPIMATTATRWGHMMEAGGLAEIGFLQNSFTSEKVPASAILGSSANSALPSAKRHAVVLRSSPSGEYTCMIVRMEEA
jgi:3-oxoacyl-(acyl-carrier-protein) synthase